MMSNFLNQGLKIPHDYGVRCRGVLNDFAMQVSKKINEKTINGSDFVDPVQSRKLITHITLYWTQEHLVI